MISDNHAREYQVDIIIPCRSPAPWLREAIASTLTDDVDVRVWVVDDGSEDDTVSSCVAMFNDPRVSCHRQQGAGPSAARNFGTSLGCAPWCMFLDSDDVLIAGGLRNLLDVALSSGGVVLGGWQNVDQHHVVAQTYLPFPLTAESDPLDIVVRRRPPPGNWLVPRNGVEWDNSRRVWEVTRYLNRVAFEVGRVAALSSVVASIRQHESASRLTHSERHFDTQVEATFWLEEYRWLSTLGDAGITASKSVALILLGLAYQETRERRRSSWVAEMMQLASSANWNKSLRPRFGSAAWSALQFGVRGLDVFAAINMRIGR